MGAGKKISQYKVGRIVKYKKEGLKAPTIAKRLDMNEDTVNLYFRRIDSGVLGHKK